MSASTWLPGRRARRAAAATTAALLAIPGAVGCGTTTPPQPPKCTWLQDSRSSQAPEAEIVAVVDGSASFDAGSRAQSLTKAVTDLVKADLNLGGVRRLSLGRFGGESDVTWVLDRVDLPQRVGSGRDSKQELKRVMACLDEALREVVKPAQVAGSDPVAALRSAGRRFTGTGSRRRSLLLLTDGLGNRGCFDLNANQDVDTLLRRCHANQELPDFGGVGLSIQGIGSPAYRDQVPGDAELPRLEGLWNALCRGTGAQRFPGRQYLDPTVPETVGEKMPSAQAIRDDPVVIQVPEVVRPPNGPVKVTLPADLLFDLDSDVLTGSARTEVTKAITALGDSKIQRVSVVGFTDSSGTPLHNLDLGRRRAQAVAGVLTAMGLPDVSTDSMGENDLVCPNDMPGGKPNKPCMAENRRVVITLWGS